MTTTGLRKISSLFRTFYFFFAFIFYILACVVIIPSVYVVYLFLGALRIPTEKYKATVGKIWLEITESLLCILIGDNTYILYKDIAEGSEGNTLIISNHITYVDWLYLWSLLLQTGRKHISFAVKEGVGKIAPLRLGMDMLNFILLGRSMETDKPRLEKACKTLRASKNYNLVLFPEGTFICKKTQEEAKEFLDKELEKRDQLDAFTSVERAEQDIHITIPRDINTVFENVIFPRIKGCKYLLDELKDEMKYIMDCTIYLNMLDSTVKYPADHFTLRNIILGRCSRMQALIICENIELDDKIRDDITTWMYKTFQKKDKLLGKLKEKEENIHHTCDEYKTKGYNVKRIHPSFSATIILSGGALISFFICAFLIYMVGFILSTYISLEKIMKRSITLYTRYIKPVIWI